MFAGLANMKSVYLLHSIDPQSMVHQQLVVSERSRITRTQKQH
jgi:hypothetical protein